MNFLEHSARVRRARQMALDRLHGIEPIETNIFGEELVNSRVEVYYDRSWYPARVLSFRNVDNKHKMEYNTGDCHWELLRDESTRIVAKSRGRPRAGAHADAFPEKSKTLEKIYAANKKQLRTGGPRVDAGGVPRSGAGRVCKACNHSAPQRADVWCWYTWHTKPNAIFTETSQGGYFARRSYGSILERNPRWSTRYSGRHKHTLEEAK